MTLESLPTDELPPGLSNEIQDFLDSQDTGHPFQFPQWTGPGSQILLLRKDGKIRWLGTFGVQILLGSRFPWIRALVANRGPVCDDRRLWESATEELAEHMRDRCFAYLDVLPEWVSQDGDHPSFANRSRWQSVGKPRASLRLRLDRDEEEIFASFRKVARYEVRRAERLGATVSAASTENDIEEFLSIYQRMAVQKGFTPDPIDHLRRVIRWLIASKSRGALLIGSANGIAHGGAVIARSGRRCWYIWGASDREEHVAVGHIVQWKSILWAKSHGCTEYDFGGYTPGATSGPAWFKEGFGGEVVPLVTTHRKVTEPKRYSIFRAIRRWV